MKTLNIKIGATESTPADEVIAWVTSRVGQSHNSRWTELAAYRTTGVLLCVESKHSLIDGEETLYEHMICGTGNDVRQFFGDGQLASALYRLPRMKRYIAETLQ